MPNGTVCSSAQKPSPGLMASTSKPLPPNPDTFLSLGLRRRTAGGEYAVVNLWQPNQCGSADMTGAREAGFPQCPAAQVCDRQPRTDYTLAFEGTALI